MIVVAKAQFTDCKSRAIMTFDQRVAEIAAWLEATARASNMVMSGDMRVSETDAAALLGYQNAASLKNLRNEGTGPGAYRAPPGRWSYSLVDLAIWLASRSTDERSL